MNEITRDRSSSVSSPNTAVTTPEAQSIDDDIWASDHEHDSVSEAAEQSSHNDMLSDLPIVKRQHMTDGYREGLSIGKAKVMQRGFDDGYPIGVSIALRAGRILGCIEGLLAARDITEDMKTSIKKTIAHAQQELAIATLFQNMNDQDIMATNTMPVSVEEVLQQWELRTFGTMFEVDTEDANRV